MITPKEPHQRRDGRPKLNWIKDNLRLAWYAINQNAWNTVEGTLDSLCPLTKLQLLLLEHQQSRKSIHGQIPNCISDMPHLQILALGDNKLFGQTIPELLCHSKHLFLINLTNNLFHQNYTNYPSCFPSYYPLQKAINEKGFTFNLERFHLHTLSRYFSQAGGGQ